MIDQLNVTSYALTGGSVKRGRTCCGFRVKPFVIKFKYEIHCQMAMENANFIDTVSSILSTLVGGHFQIVGVPEDQWLKIREGFLNNQRDHNELVNLGKQRRSNYRRSKEISWR